MIFVNGTTHDYEIIEWYGCQKQPGHKGRHVNSIKHSGGWKHDKYKHRKREHYEWDDDFEYSTHMLLPLVRDQNGMRIRIQEEE